MRRELSFCRRCSSFIGLGPGEGSGQPDFRKRESDSGCRLPVRREPVYAHANAINYTRRRDRRGHHKRTCYVPDINPASGHKIDQCSTLFSHVFDGRNLV